MTAGKAAVGSAAGLLQGAFIEQVESLKASVERVLLSWSGWVGGLSLQDARNWWLFGEEFLFPVPVSTDGRRSLLEPGSLNFALLTPDAEALVSK